MTPLVSIIVPVHNAAPFIGETLDSVLAQTYPALDVIVFDDGSTDDTPSVLERYRDRVRVFRRENQGEAATVLRGAGEARGEIIGVINADDPVSPLLVERVVETLAAFPGADAVYPDWRRIDARGAELATVHTYEFDLKLMLNAHVCIPGPGAFVRASALRDTPLRDPIAGSSADFDFWLRFALRHNAVRIAEPLASWRFHAAGASHAKARRPLARDKIATIERFFTRLDVPPKIRVLHKQAMSAAYFKAAMVGMRGRGIPVRRYLARSFALKWQWPAATPHAERRAPLHVLYLCGLPLTRWLLRVFTPMLPERQRTKAQALLNPS